MKKFIRTSIIFSLIAIFVLGLSAAPIMAQKPGSRAPSTTGIELSMIINGLEKGDKATFLISPEADESSASVIAKKTISGRDKTLAVTLSSNLEDGNYQILLDTSDKYYRTPKGYFFKVFNGQIVNESGTALTFQLIPPEGRQYVPYRLPVTGPTSSEVPTLGELPYVMEYFIGLSSPPNKTVPEETVSIRSSGDYHYVGPRFGDDNTGVKAEFEVENPGVRHGIYPDQEFVAMRVMPKKVVNGYWKWMELGWVEHSWQLDNRYLYEYDSTDTTWRYYFTVSSSTKVKVEQYSGDYWKAWWHNGTYWVQMAYEDIEFSTAANGDTLGEIYTFDGTHPSLSHTDFTLNELKISGSWDTWDSTYSAYTVLDYNPGGYSSHFSTNYYDFYVHKD